MFERLFFQQYTCFSTLAVYCVALDKSRLSLHYTILQVINKKKLLKKCYYHS